MIALLPCNLRLVLIHTDTMLILFKKKGVCFTLRIDAIRNYNPITSQSIREANRPSSV
jgi:hypothetical protein